MNFLFLLLFSITKRTCSSLFLSQDLFNLEFHILVMGSLPENAPAAGAESKGIGLLIDKRRDQIPGPALGQVFEHGIAFDAAGVGLDMLPEVKRAQDLLDLVVPVLALDEKGVDPFCLLDQTRIPGQKSPFLFLSQIKKFGILDFAEKGGIETEDLQPFGQLPQHAVHNEYHRNDYSG